MKTEVGRNPSPMKLTVNVRLEDAKGKELPPVEVYVFDPAGRFLASAPLPKGEQGEVKFELPSQLRGTAVRVLVGPHLMKEPEKTPLWMAALIQKRLGKREHPSLAILLRRGAIEKLVRLRSERETVSIAVFPDDWMKWLQCPCVVRGRLVKRVQVPDGTVKTLGVCHAGVEIYEVDTLPRVIRRLPDHQLFRLRAELRQIVRKVWPPPPPPPPPERYTSPGPITPIGGIEPLMYQLGSEAGHQSQSQALILEPKAETVFSATEVELEPVFAATSATELRTALVDKAHVVARFFCLINPIWLWRFYLHTDLIAWASTDDEGRFEATVYSSCAGDKPDLYFKAGQLIGGAWHILYDPGLACYTYWNYRCGSEVVLVVTDPAALTCAPADPIVPPPDVGAVWVAPWAIGDIRLDQIKPKWVENSAGNWHVDTDPAKRGLTDFTEAYDIYRHTWTWVDVPFGGRLCFQHGSHGIRATAVDDPNKPFYYRWLYNKLDDSEGETEWREFWQESETVVRHYEDYDDAHPELPPTLPAYMLGPQSINNMHLYEFRPYEPPPLQDHHREWADWLGEKYTGILQSANLPGGVEKAAGKYKIRLEIYDKNGNNIVPAPIVKDTFEFIVPAGLDGETILTRHADSSEIEKITKDGKDYYGFVFYVRVDNNQCVAEIYDANVKGVPPGLCGFISSSAEDKIDLSFRAYHPNGFARFKFTVVKGSSGYVNIACAPDNPNVDWPNAPLVTEKTPNDYARDDATSVFTKNSLTVTDMLGGCDRAAFGENLSVEAMATDGFERLHIALSAYALPKAFGLEPSTTSTTTT